MNNSDNRNPVFDAFTLRFASEAGAAFLSNTRNIIFGTDSIQGAATALTRGPGRYPFGTVDQAGQQGAQQQQPIASNGLIYDCKTGKCSDGSAARKTVLPWSCFNWFGLGASDHDAHLRYLCSDSNVTKNDGTSGTSGFGDFSSYGSKLLGLDSQKLIKQGAFILFALVLVYVALRSVSK